MSTSGERVVVTKLGGTPYLSTKQLSTNLGDGIGNFYADDNLIACEPDRLSGYGGQRLEHFEAAGPRQKLHFEPGNVRAGIVTCGGLAPGLNNVIRALVMELTFGYQAQEIHGFRYGYAGLNPAVAPEPMRLTPDVVDYIHQAGGTILGSSRGDQEPSVMVDRLVELGINMLFCLGGDGTLRGAHAIYEEVARRGLDISIIGIPKTIDNDIRYCQRSFGYATAVAKGSEVVQLAHVEAKGAPRCIAIVKLMGRDCGFIAAGAALSSQMVNYCLIPEVPFAMRGEGGLLELLRDRMARKDHAVIVVAEGAGQDLFSECDEAADASGNRGYEDIGIYLRDEIKAWFKANDQPVNMKYIDPSYIVRSVPANSDDAFICDQMGRNAVHAGMAGKTDLFIGFMNSYFVHVPIELGTLDKQRVKLEGPMWQAVLAATGQPRQIGQMQSAGA